MLAVSRPTPYTRPSYLNSFHRYHRRSSKKKSFVDFTCLLSRFKAFHNSRPGNFSPDMPKKHETPSSKPPKSSSTRADSDLVVRQVSGTHSNRLSSPTEGSGGGSEAQSASQRSSPPPNPSSRRSELADRPARTTNSGTGRNRTSPTPAVIDNYLAYRKQAFIKIFMARVCEWLDDNVYYLGDAQDQDGDCQRGSKAFRSGGVNKRRAAEARPAAGQKRQLKGRDQDDEGSGSDENNEQKPNKKRTKTDEDDDRQKFACPYYKNDPIRYKSHRTCVGPGWHEIHRVNGREHLYRKHRIYACNRCFEAFKSEDSLHEHQRADVPCPVLDKKKRKLDPGAGMDQETGKHLRVRRQPGKHDADKQDDVSKWYEVYYTLFPGTQDIGSPPSPWYDANPDKTNAGDSNSKDVEFLKYLRRELPHMIQRELEKDLNRSFERYGDGLMHSLSVWIRNSSARCAQIFEHIPSPAQVADLDDPETARGSRAVSPQVSPDANLTVGIDEDTGAGTGAFESTLDFDFGVPDIDISNILSFDPLNVPSDFPISDDQCFTYPDSAYGTGSVEDASGTRRSYM
ncbi:hypothetical protein CPAR01_01921 [Colletotrichum paranaense]|uniref:C2H2-type domain-containing protein n=1 Tax=Colletotrichum paranaense TaxID=1914294 RepID=A0ABQ9SYT0_9PEZI|nr:uncharacterized protein CPAR01_01921 [Colletotrichum paranaense]KAK1544419.1 hypothetical protein CPAR01_01921 [Colletotrichum paranaense]